MKITTVVALCAVACVAIFSGAAMAAKATAVSSKKAGDSPVFNVRFKTTKGSFTVAFHKDWAPLGAARVQELVSSGFYNQCAFFRAVKGFVIQFGINGNPQLTARWSGRRIPDDPSVGRHNVQGTVTFATAGPNTRTTQLFINMADNAFLDTMGFVPVGQIVQGLDVVGKLYTGYGDGPPQGVGPDQRELTLLGNAYLKKHFPQLDYIESASVVR